MFIVIPSNCTAAKYISLPYFVYKEKLQYTTPGLNDIGNHSDIVT